MKCYRIPSRPPLQRGAPLFHVERNLRPLPIVAERAVGDIEQALFEFQLGTLATSVLGRFLGTRANGDVARWAAATTETLITRLRTLAEQTATILDVLDRSGEAAGWNARSDRYGEERSGAR